MTDRVCLVDSCDRVLTPPHGRGWCSLHYGRWQRRGTVELTRLPRRRGVLPCEIDHCANTQIARGWCGKHYERWRQHGSPTARMAGEVVDGCKVCPVCRTDKPLDAYSRAGDSWCKRCVADKRAVWRLANPKPPVERVATACDACGDIFMADGRRSRYCTTSCAAANKNKANWPYMVSRRARLRGVTVEFFDRREIFERDDWTCGICNEAVDPDAALFSDRYPTIDHVIPIARGGEHSRANVQTACLLCNMRKGTSLMAEVA